MPRGDKSRYTDKQKRQAEHIEEGYEHRGVSQNEAERRAWATVNKQEPWRQEKRFRARSTPRYILIDQGRTSGWPGGCKPAAARSASAKTAAATRHRRGT